jgi:hypothetical protein
LPFSRQILKKLQKRRFFSCFSRSNLDNTVNASRRFHRVDADVFKR